MLTGLGLLYSTLFRLELTTYLPFLAVSLILWSIISAMVTEGSNCLIEQEGIAFAMATAMAPDILLMDEWFFAGDADFMEKAEQRLGGLVRDAEILVLATHSEPIVRRWCDRVIRMEGGRILQDGTVEAVPGEETSAGPTQWGHAPAEH